MTRWASSVSNSFGCTQDRLAKVPFLSATSLLGSGRLTARTDVGAICNVDFFAGEVFERRFPLCSRGISPGDFLILGFAAENFSHPENQSYASLGPKGCEVSFSVSSSNPRSLNSRR